MPVRGGILVVQHHQRHAHHLSRRSMSVARPLSRRTTIFIIPVASRHLTCVSRSRAYPIRLCGCRSAVSAVPDQTHYSPHTHLCHLRPICGICVSGPGALLAAHSSASSVSHLRYLRLWPGATSPHTHLWHLRYLRHLPARSIYVSGPEHTSPHTHLRHLCRICGICVSARHPRTRP